MIASNLWLFDLRFQGNYAIQSFERGIAALESGAFTWEIVPVDKDEGPGKFDAAKIREDTKKGVYVENLKEVEVTSARDVIQQLIQSLLQH
ncbi:hypothetical protein K1719_020512 [Acacia pycnantha]|nr:hypothetical protein K1719_020512 [Acacia pycnantha]